MPQLGARIHNGSVAASILGKPDLGLPLLIIHYLACLLAGSLYGLFFQSADKGQTFNGEPPLTSIGEIMRASIISSIKAILSVGGYMLLFGVIIALAMISGSLKALREAGAGIMEMTNA